MLRRRCAAREEAQLRREGAHAAAPGGRARVWQLATSRRNPRGGRAAATQAPPAARRQFCTGTAASLLPSRAHAQLESASPTFALTFARTLPDARRRSAGFARLLLGRPALWLASLFSALQLCASRT
jgi:hypothetical protein